MLVVSKMNIMKNCSLGYLFNFVIILLITSCADYKKEDTNVKLWPEIEPFKTGHLKVSSKHEIYYELCGNPEGIPVFVIHGGPAAGSSKYFRRFFDPEKYLIVEHDQRGCGKSTPNGELSGNTTYELVDDIERLRNLLKQDSIILFGGSWGSTLSLVYAEQYPNNIGGLVLTGIFLPTHDEEEKFWKRLALNYPQEENQCRKSLPDSIIELNNLQIFRLFSQGKDSLKKQYIKSISKLVIKASGIHVEDSIIDKYLNSEENYDDLHSSSLISFHYFANNCFLEKGKIINDASKIPDIPIYIVHGRYDMLCPPIYAFDLHKALPSSKLIINEKAGHDIKDKPNEVALLEIMNEIIIE